MKIHVHEQPQEWPASTTMGEIAANHPGATLLLINGRLAQPEQLLTEGDRCWCLAEDASLSPAEMNDILARRHSPAIQRRLAKATVGIMGLGGLGSPVAMALTRMGVGCLRLADFDRVDPSNLGRQHYFVDQLGQLKTKALAATLARINPGVKIELIDQRLDGPAIKKEFRGVDVLVECFDDPVMKATALRLALTDLKPIRYVGASGVAGYGPNNEITTSSPFPGVFLVGDGHSDPEDGLGLMASRVGIAAHHQANQVIRLLLDDTADLRPSNQSGPDQDTSKKNGNNR
ncbi:MAG: sulfur carrier protein ThiS adenylyltransferase ThiF [Thermodesulfobacteriota bacterium]